MVTLLKAFIVFAIIQFLYLPLKAQQNTFEPFPLKNESEYHIDFKIFFENNSAEKTDLQKFYDAFKKYFKTGKVVGSAEINGNEANVKIKFGPKGNKDEVFNLVKVSGKWYISSF